MKKTVLRGEHAGLFFYSWLIRFPSLNQPNLLDAMKAKIASPPGRKIYAGRLRIVEPVFANICFHKHINRFTLRTKPKVDVQWRLYAMVHNIGKIHACGRLN
ncbi:MAG: transposase [Chloroflexota bacterium]|nr:transposase [Chloroflexota bacterium]